MLPRARIYIIRYILVGCCKFYDLGHCCNDAIGILTTGCSEMSLAATTTLDESTCLADCLACIETRGNEVIGETYCQ